MTRDNLWHFIMWLMLLLVLYKMWSLSHIARTERVGPELGLEDLSCLRQWQDIAFLLVSHTFKTFQNGYNTFLSQGYSKKKKKKWNKHLGGVAIPESKTFTSKLTGWS